MSSSEPRSGSGMEKIDSEALMDHIRRNPPAVKSINEVVSLLRAISTEQRSCNDLRSCVDKVLLNMRNIRTLRDIIERLRSVSRTNGFRFEIPSSASPETRCQLVSDMFSVKIVLGTSNLPDHSPTVLDVSIKHKEDYRSCPHLANIIRTGNFLELSSHLKGLMDMYSISGSRQSKTRVFLALQSLETDIVKMSQIFRDTHTGCSTLDVTMQGTVGFLTPRLAGDRPHLAYYVSPYDLIDTSSNSRITLKDKVPREIGLHAEIGIEQKNTSCNLPISPLITNKHPIDSSGMPRFMDVSHHNSTNIQSCFVLYLKPPVPVLEQVVNDICEVSGFGPASVDGKVAKSYLELLGVDKDTLKVKVGEDTHVYHLAFLRMKATLVNKVYFSHPAHVSKILSHLRKQAHLNTMLLSCVRKFTGPKKGREWYFEVSCDEHIDKVNITMEHPSSKGTAFLEIKWDHTGFPSCKIFTSRGDPPLCNDEIVVKILSKCSSLPITMRKLVEQTMANPRREPDVIRARATTFFPTHPNILTPVPQPRFLQERLPLAQNPSVSAPSANVLPISSINFHPTTNETPVVSFPKKARENPMLTNLLKKDPPEQDQPQKNNPMLLNLLKGDDGRTDKMNVQSGQHTGTVVGNQSNMVPTANNSFGYMASSPAYPALVDPTINTTSHTMPPPPSYPNSSTQNQFATTPLPGMSPAHVPHSPYSSQRSPISAVDDFPGPVTPTNPFGIMSPGMISPGVMPGSNRGRRASRQKSHSIESHDFPTMDTPHYESQPSVESDMDIYNLNSRPGMTPLRRTESMSPSPNPSLHQPLHSLLTKNISDSSNGNFNLLTRSASVNSIKSGRSITSPIPRNLKTPEALVTLGSPMFDMNSQRNVRVKSYDSHGGDFFRSSIASASPGTQADLNLGCTPEQESDPFSFDDNKNPSKISMSENSSQSSRASRPSLFQSTSYDKDETLKEYAKTKPVLFRALTSDSPVSKMETSQLQRQLSSSGINSAFNPSPSTPVSSTSSAFDFASKQMLTSTSISTVSERMHGKPTAMEKTMQSNQIKSSEMKSEKAVKRRNSNKTDDNKQTVKKRGRPPLAKDATTKKRKVESTSVHDDSNSNPPITLNIQLSSTGAPISSTIKTKPQPGQVQLQKNSTNNNSSNATSAARNAAANSGTESGAPLSTPAFPGSLGKYLQSQFHSQQEFQKRKEMKDKKGVKPLATKPSFSSQTTIAGASAPEKVNLGPQPGKVGSVPRVLAGMPTARKRKTSIIDVVEKLHSKIPDTGVGPGTSPPGSGKSVMDKEASGSLLTKAKTLLPYQKMAHGGYIGKSAVKSPADDKVAKVVGHKSTKLPASKTLSNASIVQKQATFNQSGSLKNIRQSSEGATTNVDNTTMHQVLRQITQAAALSTKRNPMPTAVVKPGPGKIARPTPPLKPRSVTPTSTNTPINPIQRKSPSHMVRTHADLMRNAAVKISSGGISNPIVKISPLRNSSSGLPSRPSSASSIDSPIVPIMKPTSTSPTAAMLNASRKHSGTSADQHFIAPSISPTPKRTSSPLTRVEDKFKGIHRPSPTNSRISTPIPSNSPQSPDGRLLMIDDPTLLMQRDDQQPDFLPAPKTNEQHSPERATLTTPMSPPASAQKIMAAASSKRAPTPRSLITSPGISPVTSGSPLSLDDELMNEAVSG